MANEMLSLQGSIQADPFSPEHLPVPPMAPATSEDDTAVEPSTDVHDDDDDSDDDTFQKLGKISREAAVRKHKTLGVDGRKKKKQKIVEKGKDKSKKRITS